jgi:putative phage-type endonuclease
MKKYHKQAAGQRAGEWVICRAITKCRLNGEHITEFQYHEEKNKDLIQAQFKAASDAESAIEIASVKAAMDRTYVPVTSYGHQKAVENIEAETAEASRLVAEGTPEEQEAFIQERINAEVFTELLEKRNQTIALLDELKTDRDTLLNKWKTDPEFLYESVRQKELGMIDANEELSLLRRQINEYKDVHAPVVAARAEYEEQVLKDKGEWREFTGDELNGMTKTAYFESGTREWLEQRQHGVGGSDVGAILRVKGAYNTRDEIMQSKLNPITDEQVAEQGGLQSGYAGALGRGNAWEKRIFLMVKDRNPEDNITFCKTSWHNNEHTYQLANFDGTLADENGVPNGIVEIKTASDASKWGKEEDGLDGVPDTYRAQTLWYAQAAGFKRGMVAVVIDDREYRQYKFEMTAELEAEAERNRNGVAKFVEEWKERKAGTWPERHRVSGFSQAALNSSLLNNEKKEIFQEVATMRGVTAAKVQKEFISNFDKSKASDSAYVASRLRELYVETAKQPNLPDYVGIDLETAGSQPTSGSIIEYGASIRSGYATSSLARNDTELGKTSKLYGLSKKALLARGTGNIDVHGISISQIAKKRTFLNPKEGAAVLNQLTKVGVMLAHNANFEKRWLSTHVPGFADAVKKGKIRILDTRVLSKRLLPDVPNDKLESFTARYNIPYTGAHRAYNDAEMMSYGYERFLRELKTDKKDVDLAA